jgi:hypothetical protein
MDPAIVPDNHAGTRNSLGSEYGVAPDQAVDRHAETLNPACRPEIDPRTGRIELDVQNPVRQRNGQLADPAFAQAEHLRKISLIDENQVASARRRAQPADRCRTLP